MITNRDCDQPTERGDLHAPPKMDLWVLAGQSNMVGRAPLKGALLPHQRVWTLASSGQWEIANEPLHRLWESFTPIHQQMMRSGLPWDQQQLPDEHWASLERRDESGAGLGMAFGIAMTETHGRPIGLIPCAHGGTPLAWWNPAFAGAGAQNLYRAMLERIHRAQEVGQLKGILWYQGETDAAVGEDAASYAKRLADWICAVRSDTDIADLPVLVVQIGRLFENNSRYDGVDSVRYALADLPRRLHATAATSAIDLALCDDCHIGSSGLIRLGRRLSRLALRLTERSELPAGPFVTAIESIPGELTHQHAVRLILSGVTGRLLPPENMSGFSVHDDDRIVELWSADAGNDDSCSPHSACIRLLLSRKPARTTRIAYGQGPAPYCNVVDEADAPLCAFPPRSIWLER